MKIVRKAALTAAVVGFAVSSFALSASAATEQDNNARIAALQSEIAKLKQENQALKASKGEVVKLQQENKNLRAKAADAFAAAPPSPVSGYIGIYAGGDWWNWGGDGNHYRGYNTSFGGNARVNFWLSPRTSLQIDVDGEGTDSIAAWENDYNKANGRYNMDIAAHWAWWRDPTRGALAVFANITKAGNIYYSSYNGDMVQGLIGFEGQYYMNNWTWYGQLGYMARLNQNASGGYGMSPRDTLFARGVARYFYTPNDRLQAEIGFARSGGQCAYNDCGTYGTSHPTYVNWGAVYEHRFAGSMWSMYGEYAGFRVSGRNDSDGSFHATSNNLMGGIRLHFGQPTLLAEDRNGATFDSPGFLRALDWTYLGGGFY